MSKWAVIFAATTVGLTLALVYKEYLSDPLPPPLSPTCAALVSAEPSNMGPQPSAAIENSRVAQYPDSIASPGDVATPTLSSRSSHGSREAADVAYRLLALKIENPELAEALRLTPDEASSFFYLLAEQQARDAQWELSPQASAEGNQKARNQRFQANKSEQVALLGEGRRSDWERYTNSVGARSDVREVRLLLADTDYPLRRDQYEPLVDVLSSEQARYRTEAARAWQMQSNPEFPTPIDTVEYMTARLELLESSLQRRRRAAQSILSTEQMRRFDQLLELERARAQVEYDAIVTVNREKMKEPRTAGQ